MLASSSGTFPAANVSSGTIEIDAPCQSNGEDPDACRFANHMVGNRSTRDGLPPSYSSLFLTNANASATSVCHRTINDTAAQSSELYFTKDRAKAIAGSQPASLSVGEINDSEFDVQMAEACLSGDINKVDALLKMRPAGIHRFQKYSSKLPYLHPLHLAAINNEIHLIHYLCQYPSIDINVRNNAEQTPLMMGIIKNNAKAVEVLLNHGAQIEVCPHELYKNSLYAAIAGDKKLHEDIDEQRDLSVLELLLNRGGDPNQQLCSKEGITPLHVAAHFGAINIIDMLIKHGANVRIKNCRDATPMHFAALAKKTEAVKRLIEHGATLEEESGSIDHRFWHESICLRPKTKYEEPPTLGEAQCKMNRLLVREPLASLSKYGEPLSFLENEDHGALRALEKEQIMLRKQQLPEQHNGQRLPTRCRLL